MNKHSEIEHPTLVDDEFLELVRVAELAATYVYEQRRLASTRLHHAGGFSWAALDDSEIDLCRFLHALGFRAVDEEGNRWNLEGGEPDEDVR